MQLFLSDFQSLHAQLTVCKRIKVHHLTGILFHPSYIALTTFFLLTDDETTITNMEDNTLKSLKNYGK